MTTITDKSMESFFSDNESFCVVDFTPSKKSPSQVMDEYNKNGPRSRDPYNTDDSTDADTDYNENDIAVTSGRRPSFIKDSINSFRKRIKTMPTEVKKTFTGESKTRFFCCFRQNT